jgi:hypothetical protein
MITTTHNQDVERAEATALVTPGTLLAWGSNTAGQLGDGTTTNRTAPVAVPSVAGIKDIATGVLGDSYALIFSCRYRANTCSKVPLYFAQRSANI